MKNTSALLRTSFFLMMLLSGNTSSEPVTSKSFEIKGAYVGMPLTEFRAAHPHPKALCSDRVSIDLDVNYIGQTICHTRDISIAREQVFIIFKFLTQDMEQWSNDRLYDIAVSFKHSSYNAIKSALLNKFGPPSHQLTETYSNPMGMTVEGELSVWRSPSETMLLTEYAGKLDQSILHITHDGLTKEFERRRINEEGSPDSDI